MSAPNAIGVATHRFASFDGTELAWHEVGGGRTVLLLHGYLSNAATNWIRYGHAERLAAVGFRVVMPDLRAHGDSAKPHDVASYPSDVLTDDAFALIKHLGLVDYDLGGYSLGARTSVRLLARGARPRRVVLAGMGFQGVVNAGGRNAHFRRVFDNLGNFEKFTPEWNVQAFLKTTKGDVEALRLLLDSFVDTPPETLGALAVPTLVVAGVEDEDVGSIDELAAALHDAILERVPGGHMSAVTKPELGQAIARFLSA